MNLYNNFIGGFPLGNYGINYDSLYNYGNIQNRSTSHSRYRGAATNRVNHFETTYYPEINLPKDALVNYNCCIALEEEQDPSRNIQNAKCRPLLIPRHLLAPFMGLVQSITSPPCVSPLMMPQMPCGSAPMMPQMPYTSFPMMPQMSFAPQSFMPQMQYPQMGSNYGSFPNPMLSAFQQIPSANAYSFPAVQPQMQYYPQMPAAMPQQLYSPAMMGSPQGYPFNGGFPQANGLYNYGGVSNMMGSPNGFSNGFNQLGYGALNGFNPQSSMGVYAQQNYGNYPGFGSNYGSINSPYGGYNQPSSVPQATNFYPPANMGPPAPPTSASEQAKVVCCCFPQ